MITRLTMLAIVLAALCTPRSAEASRYVWNNLSGEWTNPTNWTQIDGPQNDGFPNRPGDEAHFTDNYTAPRTVTIPDGRTVTVGVMYFSKHAITINAAGTGRMRMQHTLFTGAVITRIDPAPAGFHDVISAPIELRSSDLTVTISSGASRMTFDGTISNNLCACGVTKLGPGRMLMRASNTYLGRTQVERGILELVNAPAPSVRGSSLAIGPATMTPQDPPIVAEVLVNSPNQIADDTQVEVKRGGVLFINAEETVGATTVTHATISVTSHPAGTCRARHGQPGDEGRGDRIGTTADRFICSAP